MTRTEYPGALFVDAWPDGEQVLLYPNSRLETHLGRIEFPPGEHYGPLFLDSAIIHGFEFVGLAHDGGGMLRWRAGVGWVPGPPFKSGRGVFDHAGAWRDTLPAGYQFVNDSGVPVSRNDTYGPTHGLSEWVEVDGLLIGQGHDSLFPEGRGGIHLWDGTHHRHLDDGVCFFLKRRRIGDRATVSWAKSGTGAVVWRGTLAELRARPLSVYKPDIVLPPIVVPPVPEPDPMTIPDHTGLAIQIYTAHPPAKTVEGAFLYTRRLAWTLRGEGCGLLIKPDGENIVPFQGESFSAARVCYPDGQIFKVMTNVPEGDPTWAANGIVDSARYRAAVAVEGTDPGDDPDDPDDPPDLPPQSDVLARIEARLAALEGAQRVTIKNSRNQYLRPDWSDDMAHFDREQAGEGEILTLERAP